MELINDDEDKLFKVHVGTNTRSFPRSTGTTAEPGRGGGGVGGQAGAAIRKKE